MPATAGKYTPRFLSEKRMSPTNGCRLSSLIHLVQMSTLGEEFIHPNGKLFTIAEMTVVMRQLRKNTDRGIMSLGYNRDNALTAWRESFPHLADKLVRENPRHSDIVKGLRSGFSYSLSGNNKRCPVGSPLRLFTNHVAHEIALVDIRQVGTTAKGNSIWEIFVMEPMGTQGIHKGFWVPSRHVRLFGKEFSWDSGRRIALKVRNGGGTQKVLAVAPINERKNELKQKAAEQATEISELEGKLDRKTDIIAEQGGRIDELEQEVQDLGDPEIQRGIGRDQAFSHMELAVEAGRNKEWE